MGRPPKKDGELYYKISKNKSNTYIQIWKKNKDKSEYIETIGNPNKALEIIKSRKELKQKINELTKKIQLLTD